MKFLNKYKFEVALAGNIMMLLLVVYLFFNAIKKDHTLELYKLEMLMKEKAREAIIQERRSWEDKELQLNIQITTLQIKDSLLALQTQIIDNRLAGLPKKYNEKAKEIDNLMDGDLLDYFNKLEPQPNNDY